MRINGGWFETDERLPQPVMIGALQTADGRWVKCPFLIDTGADTTVFSPKVLRQLGRPITLAPKQLLGVGGQSKLGKCGRPSRSFGPTGNRRSLKAHTLRFRSKTHSRCPFSVMTYSACLR